MKAKRQKAEKALIKDGKDVSYPSWDALKEEDLEAGSKLIFTVRDTDGNIVRRIPTAAKKGFNRLNWDLRYPGFEPINAKGDNDSGPLVVPGTYQVSLSKFVNGVETDYGQNQSFEVAAIDNRTFASNDRKADLAFDMKAGRLNKAISGASRFLNELEKRIDFIAAATTETVNADQSLLGKADTMRRTLAEIKLSFEGDSVVSNRSEPTPTSVTGYIGYLLWSRSESTGPVTPSQKLRFKRASEGYAKTYTKITQLSDDVAAAEKILHDAESGWIPGTLPLKGI